MATTSSFAFSALTMRSFCSGTTRAKTCDVGHAPRQLVVGHPLELGPGERVLAVREPGLPGDALGGRRIVAGDHHDANAGGLTLRDRGGHRGPQRILEPEQADELEGEVVVLVRGAPPGEPRLGRRRGPAGPATRESLTSPASDARSLGRQMAEIGDGLGSALGGHDDVAAVAVPQPWLTARSPGVSGYSRTSDQRGCRCSVPSMSRSPASCSARSIGSKGSRLLARIAYSRRS